MGTFGVIGKRCAGNHFQKKRWRERERCERGRSFGIEWCDASLLRLALQLMSCQSCSTGRLSDQGIGFEDTMQNLEVKLEAP